jgi:hypothetical protein
MPRMGSRKPSTHTSFCSDERGRTSCASWSRVISGTSEPSSRPPAALGHEVHGLTSASYEGCDFGSPAPIPSLALDVRDVEARHLQGFDAVIHLAALSNDPLGDINPELTYDINYRASGWPPAERRRAALPLLAVCMGPRETLRSTRERPSRRRRPTASRRSSRSRNSRSWPMRSSAPSTCEMQRCMERRRGSAVISS